MNALLDYGSSSSSSDSEDENEDKSRSIDDSLKPKLPKPTLGESSLQTSVFSNPFAAAEMAKSAILEKHVKMLVYPFMHTIVKYIGNDCKVPGKDNMVVINGKKICWNHRKGRCRFGHNCKYAHDTDLQKTAEELDAEKQKLRTVVCEGSGTMTSQPPPEVLTEPKASTDDIWESGSTKRKMKRPGLSQNITPGKKVLKIYKEQKLKDKIKKT